MEENTKNKTEQIFLNFKNILNGIDTKSDFNNRVDRMYYYENDCVSVCDMQCVVKRRDELGSYLVNSENVISQLIKRYKISDDCKCYALTCCDDVLSFTLEDYMGNNSEYKVYKKDDKLHIEEVLGGNFSYTNKVVEKLEEDLSKIYDDFLIYKCYEKDVLYSIPSINSDFVVNFKKDGASRLSISDNEKFSLKMIYFPFDFYYLQTKSNINLEFYYLREGCSIKTYIEKNAKVFFENTFVRIEDCPYFMKEDLYKIKNDKINDFLDNYKSDNKFKVLSKRFIDFFYKR